MSKGKLKRRLKKAMKARREITKIELAAERESDMLQKMKENDYGEWYKIAALWEKAMH